MINFLTVYLKILTITIPVAIILAIIANKKGLNIYSDYPVDDHKSFGDILWEIAITLILIVCIPIALFIIGYVIIQIWKM